MGAPRGSTAGRCSVPSLPAHRSGPGALGTESSPWPSPWVSPATRVTAFALCSASGGVWAAGQSGRSTRPWMQAGALCSWALSAAARASAQWSTVSGSQGLHCSARPRVACRRRAPDWQRPCSCAGSGPGLQGRGLRSWPTFPAPRTARRGRGLPRAGGPGPAGLGTLGCRSAPIPPRGCPRGPGLGLPGVGLDFRQFAASPLGRRCHRLQFGRHLLLCFSGAGAAAAAGSSGGSASGRRRRAGLGAARHWPPRRGH